VIDLNYTLFIQAGLFIFLMLVLNAVFFKPFLRFIEQRQGKISGDEKEAARLQEEAERRRLLCDEGLNKGRLQALEEKGHIQDAGVHEGKQVVHTVRQQVEEEIAKTKAQISLESQQALTKLGRRQGDLAQEIAEKILGRSLQ
jgi:F-type H+-transporting ATPase subunit b